MSVPTVFELEQTFGVILIGYVVAMTAFGITVFQTYVYYSKYPMDSAWLKTMVGSLCFLDATMSTLLSHATYHYLISQYPFTTGLIYATSTYAAELGISVVALFIVQLFYAFQTWRASKNILVSILSTSTSLAGFVLGLVVAANLVRDNTFASLSEGPSKIVMITSLSLVFLSSLLAVAALSHHLRPSINSPAPIGKRFDDQAVTYLISHGGLAALFQLSFVLLFATYPAKPLWMPFQFLSSKVFTNSMLMSLNSRKARNGRALQGSANRGGIGRPSFVAEHTSNVCFNVVESRSEEDGKEIGTPRTDSVTVKQAILNEDYKRCWQDEVEHTTPSASTAA